MCLSSPNPLRRISKPSSKLLITVAYSHGHDVSVQTAQVAMFYNLSLSVGLNRSPEVHFGPIMLLINIDHHYFVMEPFVTVGRLRRLCARDN